MKYCLLDAMGGHLQEANLTMIKAIVILVLLLLVVGVACIVVAARKEKAERVEEEILESVKGQEEEAPAEAQRGEAQDNLQSDSQDNK